MNYVEIDQAIRRGRAGTVCSWAVDVLTDIIEGRRDVAAVRHPLGFICLPLHRDRDDGICVHLWSPHLTGARPTTSPIHSHSWNLLSLVLFGEVHNEIVEVTDEPVDPTYRVFEARSLGRIDELVATSRLVRHAAGAVEVCRAGEAYALLAGDFHTTVVPAGRVGATVALGQTGSGARDLSLGAIGGRTHRVQRQMCDPAETVQAARAVIDRLLAGRPRNPGRWEM